MRTEAYPIEEKSENVQAEKKAIMFGRLPAAWYDLSCRIKTIQAVTEALPESVDVIRTGNLTEEEKRARLDQIYGLADAVCVLLDLAAADAERLERQLVSTAC